MNKNFDYLGNTQISSYGIGYNISNINGLQTTHSDFYNGIVALQSPDASKTNKFKVQGYYSYVAATINAIPLAQLTTPNVTYFKATAKLDIPTAVQYPCNAMMLTMASMFNDLNMGYPFYATNGQTATLWCTASTNQVTYPTQDSMNQLTGQGFETFASGFAMGAIASPVNNSIEFLSTGYNKLFNKEAYREF